ncbi:3-oxoadipyl-CoA thiolase [Meiothermus ruber]|jgi:acetyl-CoA C-acetyltransferase|uniref:Beta-ketoadipyl-CoA thiolase n=1 Tax=Meiothermus ruber (strain ATCC 35948 / DSM 1279 / VKM B-1258 / 21) TaxID=504728 RepID=D3PRK2_MEIRD|nr:3-oxoadipyl-CoA thiolase [Meiothermus ruber]ADD28085.1 acetyl-CoA acetyltransferase [Meiothermus ruber DSM 1279]AGK04554.1 acetyl-CoA acetyltransferase [Meiothermus ruber DSM 1279]MCL6528796.1 3-oxoadipyl-CoA thiolase [Meiothermus ruber]
MTMEAYILDAVRTPVGKHGGALSSVRPDDLGAIPLKALLERTGIPGSDVEDVYMGCANQAGEDNRNVARMSLLLAGLPISVGGSTVNRLCGSGLDAVASAARAIWAGEGQVYLGGGVESMSRAPWVMPKAEKGFATGNVTLYDTTLGWRLVNPRMKELYGTEAMGETAENLAEQYKISREAQDRFALHSHQKAIRAQQSGAYASQMVPVEVKDRKGNTTLVQTDEGPRADTSLEALAQLRPVFRAGGSVTAGNSSSLNDGAAAVLLVADAYARAHGLKPMARVRAIAVAGVEPRIMGIGPVPATQKALQRAGLTLQDIGLIELNEAFAAQSLAVLQEWGLEPEDERLNVNGGAIAIGHPLGCSGARILTNLVHEMQRRQVQFGLATMCIGVGQGIAMVVERV